MSDTLLQTGKSAPPPYGVSEDHKMLQYQHSYPADPNANHTTKQSLRAVSAIMAGSEMIVSGNLMMHLFSYITTINRSPDTILIASAMYFILSFLKFGQGLHNFSFAGQHTDRTPENWDSVLRLAKVTGALHLLVSGGLYGLITYIEGYASLDSHTSTYTSGMKSVLATQAMMYVGFHYLQNNLKNKEDEQTRVVDAGAADAVRFELAKRQ